MKKLLILVITMIMAVATVNSQSLTIDELAEKARQSKDDQALLDIGYEYWKAKKYDNAATFFRLSAELGNAQAQLDIGNCYRYGNGVYKDEKQAIEWYKKAAAQGYQYVYFTLGECYADGIGVPQNFTEALKWYRKLVDTDLGEFGEKYIQALQNEDAELMWEVGCYWCYGDVRNYEKAFKCQYIAANWAYPDSQCELGRMYYTGTGTDVNYKAAAEWFQYAANQNSAEGQFWLGKCYEQGQGVNKNTETALELYRKAASKGYKEAQKRLNEIQNSTEKDNISQTNNTQSKELNDNEIYNSIISLKNRYPEGTPWTNSNKYTWNNIMPNSSIYNGFGCMGFAMLASDAAFGNAPAYKYYDTNKIKIGDILRINNDAHSVIVLSKNGNKLTIAEGNYGSKIHWGREIDIEQCNFVYGLTRY